MGKKKQEMKTESKLFMHRYYNLKLAASRAKNPEWKELWISKLDELVLNEKAKLSGERGNDTIH